MKIKATQKFTGLLMQWHATQNNRVMPWKGIKDPYKIWLSEIILQQTRVEQGLSYYEKFVHNYPTIHDLANANDDVVFKLWEGLGYYSRCKNLLLTARLIVQKHKGVFPNNYDELIELKGIGPYTAAAIASFAFNLPYAVLDGNVFRVLARFFGNDTAIDSTKGKQLFAEIANKVLDKNEPGLFNQAIMDFGATICKPALPNCGSCVLDKNCVALKSGTINKLPIKEKVLTKKNRWFYYFLIEHNDQILVNKRTGNDIWQSLYEFYLVETEVNINWNEQLIKSWLLEQFGIKKVSITLISGTVQQQLTHQKIKGQFIKIQIPQKPLVLENYEWISVSKLKNLAFPKFINQFLEQTMVQKNLF